MKMEPYILLQYVLSGGLLGMLGQGIRTLIGIRKMLSRSEAFVLFKLITSLIIGFTAGALSILIMLFQNEKPLLFDSSLILLLISYGYAGVDIIESFYSKYLAKPIEKPGKPSSGEQIQIGESPLLNSEEAIINFKSGAKKEVVSLYALSVIKDVLRASGNPKALITSTARTPMEQAKAMYNNLIGDPKNILEQKDIYGPNGDQVIDVYAKNYKSKSQSEVIDLMWRKIIELGPSNVSRHCADFNERVVVDIAPSSIKYQGRFKEEVYSEPRIDSTRFFDPSKNDPAFHIEIPSEENSSEIST